MDARALPHGLGAAVGAVCVGENVDRLEAQRQRPLEEGRIGFAHLRLMASKAEAIDRSPTALALFDETRLLAQAESISLNRFRTECAHLRHAADREAFLAAQVEAREWSSLRLCTMDGGGLELTGYLDAEGGALVRTAPEPWRHAAATTTTTVSERRSATPWSSSARTLDVGLVPARASQRSHVQVTGSTGDPAGLVGAPAGEMEHAGSSRQHCGSAWRATPPSHGSWSTRPQRSSTSAAPERVVPGATRRALNARDKGCRWSGCDRTASWTAAHHVVHWAHGGATGSEKSRSALLSPPLAGARGGWQIARSDDGSLVTMPPRPLARSPDFDMVA